MTSAALTKTCELEAKHQVFYTSAIKLLFSTYFIQPRPWTLTFWYQNLKRLSLSLSQCINSISLVKIHPIRFKISSVSGLTNARTYTGQKH